MLLPGHIKEATLPGNVACIDIIDEDCTITISLVYHPGHKNPLTLEFIRFYIDQIEENDRS